MRIIESGAFDEIRRLQVNKAVNDKKPETAKSGDEAQVIEENTRAVSLALNDKTFEVNLEKVERIKKEIEDGSYKYDTTSIAKEILLSDKRGDIKLGLFS
ncbi:MAG: hypothetical protein A2Y40_07055 [Candidatus Margulisbacteria bacterium GWF2_35_9]|nr:MAG: hypothetical protein A2Y40_07055 [Candidatus Margulisbacteria bacterium GWF2_35_9]